VRDMPRWQQNIQSMIASQSPWQLITTFNEWGEGTSVESSSAWATASGWGAYLDALHTNGGISLITGSRPGTAPPPTTPPANPRR